LLYADLTGSVHLLRTAAHSEGASRGAAASTRLRPKSAAGFVALRHIELRMAHAPFRCNNPFATSGRAPADAFPRCGLDWHAVDDNARAIAGARNGSAHVPQHSSSLVHEPGTLARQKSGDFLVPSSKAALSQQGRPFKRLDHCASNEQSSVLTLCLKNSLAVSWNL
jgi:hypothetical protein